jgi:hypothetical protein
MLGTDPVRAISSEHLAYAFTVEEVARVTAIQVVQSRNVVVARQQPGCAEHDVVFKREYTAAGFEKFNRVEPNRPALRPQGAPIGPAKPPVCTIGVEGGVEAPERQRGRIAHPGPPTV